MSEKKNMVNDVKCNSILSIETYENCELSDPNNFINDTVRIVKSLKNVGCDLEMNHPGRHMHNTYDGIVYWW